MRFWDELVQINKLLELKLVVEKYDGVDGDDALVANFGGVGFENIGFLDDLV
jgi:hypothetical protein